MSNPIQFSSAEEDAVQRLSRDSIEGAEVFYLELDGKPIAGHRTKFFENKSGASASFGQMCRSRYGFPKSVNMSQLRQS